MRHSRIMHIVASGTILGLVLLCQVCANASDNKKTALASVRRIVLTLPYFGTPEYLDDLPSKSQPTSLPKSSQDETRSAKPSPEQQKRNAEENRAFLAKLETITQDTLKARLKERTPFEWVSVFTPIPQITKNDRSKPKDTLPNNDFFLSKGRIKGTKFPVPNPEAVRRLAADNHADAVLLTVMDEPKRDGGGYFFDISGVGYISPHAAGKIAFYLYLANGTEVLHEYVEVLHPISKIGNRDYTQVDMTETYAQIIENFLDELTRYTPKR